MGIDTHAQKVSEEERFRADHFDSRRVVRDQKGNVVLEESTLTQHAPKTEKDVFDLLHLDYVVSINLHSGVGITLNKSHLCIRDSNSPAAHRSITHTIHYTCHHKIKTRHQMKGDR